MGRIRNQYELSLMRTSGEIAASALNKALGAVKVGVSGLDLDRIAQNEIFRLGGDLSYKTVPNYKFATCVTVNEQVVHGLPTDRKFREGDLVGIDLAVIYRGWHTDCAWSILVEDGSLKIEDRKEKERFLKVGQEALLDGIAQAVEEKRVGDISEAIQTKIEQAGYSIVRALVGHGIGRSLHEEPEIPGYGKKDTGMLLKSGMALAIEVIYAKGGYEVVLQEDGWTYATADKSWGGLFEMTVVVGPPAGEAGKKKAEVLTDWRKL